MFTKTTQVHFYNFTYTHFVWLYLPMLNVNCRIAVQKCMLSQLIDRIFPKKCTPSHATTSIFPKKWCLSHAIPRVFYRKWSLSHAIGNGLAKKWPPVTAISSVFGQKCPFSHTISSVCSNKWCLSHILKLLLLLMFRPFIEGLRSCLREIPPELQFNRVLINPDTFLKWNNPRD